MSKSMHSTHNNNCTFKNVVIILIVISITLIVTVNCKGGGRGGGGSRGGGGGIFGGRGGGSKSSGGGGWFGRGKSTGMGKSTGWTPKGGGASKPWPKSSSSVMYGGRSTRIIPIPLFIPMGGMGFGGYGGYGHGYGYGHNSYARRQYRAEDGFYPCPPEVVEQHRATLNKSIDEAIKDGTFTTMFQQTMNMTLNGTSLTNTTAGDNGTTTVGVIGDSGTTNNDYLVNQLQSAIANYTFMCYDESRDQSNDDGGGDSVFGLLIVIALVGSVCFCFFCRNVKEANNMQQMNANPYTESTPVNFQQRVPSNALLVTPRQSMTPMSVNMPPSAPPMMTNGYGQSQVINDPPPSYEETVKKNNTLV